MSNFTYIDSRGFSAAVLTGQHGAPAPETAEYSVWVLDHVPSAVRFGGLVASLAANPGAAGFSFEYSADGVTWTPSGIVWDLEGITGPATFSVPFIPGIPAPIFIRPTWVNQTGDVVSLGMRQVTFSFR